MKTETVAEFLARGGHIVKVPEAELVAIKDNIKSTQGGGVPLMMTMEEADLYHGEKKLKKPKKAKPVPGIDIHSLPEALRKKYIDGIMTAEMDEEDD